MVGRSVDRATECCAQFHSHLSELAAFTQTLGADDGRLLYGSRLEGHASPTFLRGGSILVVAAGHVANRAELCRRLRISSDSSTCRLLGEAWLAWGELVGNLVIGDWALAVWRRSPRQVALARSVTSSKPLFYSESESEILFASKAQAVAAATQSDSTPDWSAIAHFMTHMVLPQDRTAFAGVRRVPTGCAIIWEEGRSSRKEIWRPSLEADLKPRTWAHELRTALEVAVSDLLPTSGVVASQLSSGRDSSAVTAVAAMLAPGRVIAITFGPRPGTVPLQAGSLILDETRQAQATASALGIPHVQVDGGSIDNQVSWLSKLQRFAFLPLLSAPGAGLRMAVSAAAKDAGAEVMLTGALGNLGLSSGGIQFLSEYRREEGTRAWFELAARIARTKGWKTVLNHSAPIQLRQRVRAFCGRKNLQAPSMWSGFLAAGLMERKSLADAARTTREEVFHVLQEMETADTTTAAFHGVELLDPTGDQRIIDIGLTAPARMLIDKTNGRPLFEEAFGDILPSVILQERRRGRQAADWWTAFSPHVVRSLLEEVSEHRFVQGALDIKKAEPLLQSWPQTFREAMKREDEFQDLLGSLSIALFLQQNF